MKKRTVSADQVVAIIVPATMAAEDVTELMGLVAYWFDKEGFTCFSCGDKCETASMMDTYNEDLDSFALFFVPSCETCAKELEDGNETLMELFQARIRRLIEKE
jgi:hypothetical protein